MPIQYTIDVPRRLVISRVTSRVTADDFFAYQQTVWTQPAVSGFDELVDMTEAAEIEGATGDAISAFAGFSSEMDSASPTKLAIIAPGDLFFGLARMYEAYRETAPHSTRKVGVFRTRAEAETWLAGGPS